MKEQMIFYGPNSWVPINPDFKTLGILECGRCGIHIKDLQRKTSTTWEMAINGFSVTLAHTAQGKYNFVVLLVTLFYFIF